VLPKGTPSHDDRPLPPACRPAQAESVNDRQSDAYDPAVHRRRWRRFGRTLVTLELLLAAGGLAGGIRMMAAPYSAMPMDWLDGTPFGSWFWPGAALTIVNGLWPGVVAIGALRGRAFAHVGHLLVGVTLAGWIVVQVAMVGYVSWLQPAYLGWGLLLTVLGFAHYRAWHLRWGATDAEASSPLPGDDLIRAPHFASTRAVTVNAPPRAVWPWIVQMGYGRAGWYSYDLLDNRGRPSASRIEPGLQTIDIGDWVSMAPKPNATNAFRIHAFTPNTSMVWSKPDSAWVWDLRPLPGGRTRLISRVRVRYQRGLILPLALVLMELGDFPMMRRCLLGIKHRAERDLSPREPAGHASL
jgi:hypothetical protein